MKNTNIEMATAALALDYYGADAPAKAEALAAASSQYGEIVSYANYGYLGRFDKGFTVAGKSSMDDHNSFEAYLLLRTSQLLSRKDFGDAAVTHYRAYAPKGTPAYVAYAACHFAALRTTRNPGRTRSEALRSIRGGAGSSRRWCGACLPSASPIR